MNKGLRVLYFGMLGEYSRIPLLELLSAGMDICAVIIPAAERQKSPEIGLRPMPAPELATQLPMVNPYVTPNIVHIAWDQQIPVFEMHNGSNGQTVNLLHELKPDVACVACFSQILPLSILSLPPLGFLNLHPSWLPEYRGPVPLFWTLRHGKQETGITVQFMTETADTGDIVVQAPVRLPDGISGSEAERLCAAAGAPLLVDTIRRLHGGDCPRQSQGEGGSYYPMPSAADFQIPLTWSARHAFNFIRGTEEWGRPYPVVVGDERILLSSAIGFRHHGELGRTITRAGKQVWLQFNPGVLQATISAWKRPAI
jgi:methionyl-tRNA formyltransferase